MGEADTLGASGVTEHRYSRRFFGGPVLAAVSGAVLVWGAWAAGAGAGGSGSGSADLGLGFVVVSFAAGLFLFAAAVFGIRTALSVYETSAAGIRKAGAKGGWTAWNQIESVTLHEKSETSVITTIIIAALARSGAKALGASERTARFAASAAAAAVALKDAAAPKKITPGAVHRRFPRGRTWLFGGKYLVLRLALPGGKKITLTSQLSGFDDILAAAAAPAAQSAADEATRHNFRHLGLLPDGAADAIPAPGAVPQPG